MASVLDGYTIGITADRRADEQIVHFERRGAEVIHAPAIHTVPLVESDRVEAATRAVLARPPDVVIANTGVGMRSWIGAAEACGLGEALLDVLRRAVVIARGAKAAGVMAGYGVDVAARPDSGRLVDCIALARSHVKPGEHVVVQRDGSSTVPDVESLHGLGADVTAVSIYRWRRASDPTGTVRLATAVIAGRVHAVTFTAAPAIRSWFELAAHQGLEDALRDRLASGSVVVGCVGPVCAEAAVAEGIGSGDLVVPDAARLGPMVAAVSDRLAGKAVRVGDLVISGTVVHFGARRVDLSDIEARILAVLAHGAGAVISKADLLREVWGDPGGDPHLVEVAIGRLRRRLGDDSDAVVAVPRRGYALNLS